MRLDASNKATILYTTISLNKLEVKLNMVRNIELQCLRIIFTRSAMSIIG